jgi:hypothetical protein
MISIHTQLMRLPIALQGMHLTYRHWIQWRNSPWAGQRQLALKAKTFGLITYDRIMTMGMTGERA